MEAARRGAGVPAYSRASFTVRCRRYAGFQPCAAYRLHAGREAPDLSGQVWCLLAAFLLVVVLQGSEPEAEGREAAGISIFNKTWVCLAARNQFGGEVRLSSPCRRGGGRERGRAGAEEDAGWCWELVMSLCFLLVLASDAGRWRLPACGWSPWWTASAGGSGRNIPNKLAVSLSLVCGISRASLLSWWEGSWMRGFCRLVWSSFSPEFVVKLRRSRRRD